MRTFRSALLIISLSCVACDSSPIACTLLYAYGITATVTDPTNGGAIPNATLTLTDGSYQETMQHFGSDDYVGAGERAGTYTLTASAPGYEDKTIPNIVVTRDQCHVMGVHVDVQMQPSP